MELFPKDVTTHFSKFDVLGLDVETISISLNSETLAAITSEAEIRDFDSRSAYLRHIIQNRSQLESLDQTEVGVVEAVAEQLKEHQNKKISEFEVRLQNFETQMESIHHMAEQTTERYEYIERTEERISEIESSTNSNQNKLSRYSRETNTNQKEIRDHKKEIEHLKGQIRALKSDIREISESEANSL
ncbi:hypothetical protein [Halorubrum persicum]|uniref:hypothetical protein n=1 Tax=Halorubrum persicum TaxID=1383844 RepID=UPI001181BE74|nr:hypothetical protein [Halorubrum persicum]